MERTEHHLGPFAGKRILGQYLFAPSSPGPFVLLLNILDLSTPHFGSGQMGSYANGVGWDLTGFCFFSPVGARLVPLKTHDFKGFRPDFKQTLTGF